MEPNPFTALMLVASWQVLSATLLGLSLLRSRPERRKLPTLTMAAGLSAGLQTLVFILANSAPRNHADLMGFAIWFGLIASQPLMLLPPWAVLTAMLYIVLRFVLPMFWRIAPIGPRHLRLRRALIGAVIFGLVAPPVVWVPLSVMNVNAMIKRVDQERRAATVLPRKNGLPNVVITARPSGADIYAMSYAYQRDCSREGKDIVIRSKGDVLLTVRNDRMTPVRVYQLDAALKRIPVMQVAPGEVIENVADFSQPWVVTDTQDLCIGYFTALSPGGNLPGRAPE